MGNSLDTPKTEKRSGEIILPCGHVGYAGMQGWRAEMEDAHIVGVLSSLEDHTIVGVFDGHGGAGAAQMAEGSIAGVLQDSSEWKSYYEDPDKNPALLGKALIHAFIEFDRLLENHQKIAQTRDISGCTAVLCMITPKHFVCANAGDSRCVLASNGETIALSFDHKPGDEEEDRRIKAAGGVVNWKRIDGELAVSRAFGDFDYKKREDLLPSAQKVSCVPDISVTVRNNAVDQYLILACDGVWDVMTSSEAVENVREIVEECGEGDMQLVTEELIDLALNKGSTDNISAIVARLPGAVVGDASRGGVRRRRTMREQENISVISTTENDPSNK